MMWGDGYGDMMNWGSGFGLWGIIGIIFWIILFVDAILLGLWLWKQIQKGK